MSNNLATTLKIYKLCEKNKTRLKKITKILFELLSNNVNNK